MGVSVGIEVGEGSILWVFVGVRVAVCEGVGLVVERGADSVGVNELVQADGANKRTIRTSK